MDAAAIAARRSSLSRVPREPSARARAAVSEPANPYKTVRLRKTGFDTSQDSWTGRGWFDWLGDFTCSAWCANEDDISVRPRQRITRDRVDCRRCGEPIYNAQEGYSYDGHLYHKTCFQCFGCNRSLAFDGMVKYVRQGKVFCQTCVVRREDNKRRASTEHVVGETQEQAGMKRQPSTRGDVNEVLDTIGDRLEETFRQLVPRCEICGGTFNFKSDDIEYRIQGDKRVPVAHAECRRLGRPRDGLVKSAQPPRLAVKAAPAKFVVKIAGNNKNLTIFFVKETVKDDAGGQRKHSKAENEEPASVRYSFAPPEGESLQSKKRRRSQLATFVSGLDTTTFQVAADDFVKAPTQPNRQRLGPKKVRQDVVLETVKARLRHQIRISFDMSKQEADPVDMVLTISIAEYGDAASRRKFMSDVAAR